MWTYYYTYPNYLAHYGIKGVKWGVRRYQNADGTLTAAGKSRYYDPKLEKAIQADNAIYKKTLTQTKSRHQLALEQKYKNQGMNSKTAAVAAYKRVRLEKTIAAVAAVSAVALTAYVAKKHYDKVTDQILDSNAVLKRVARDTDTVQKYAFYATPNKADENRYAGFYGASMKARGDKVYQKSFSVKTPFKVASYKSGKDAMRSAFKNDAEFNKSMKSLIANGDRMNWRSAPWKQAQKDMASGKGVTDAVYKCAVQALGWGDKTSRSVQSQYYSKLKKAGYSAISDYNDIGMSGYRSNNPIIVFDTDKAVISGIRELSSSQIANMKLKATLQNVGKYTAGAAAVIASVGGISATSATAAKSAKENKIVAQYQKEHPNSSLSRAEILANYYNE